jgi:hypothetical protein
MRRAKESANAVSCQSNLRQLMAGVLMFAQDMKNCLPGNKQDGTKGKTDPNVSKPNADDMKRDWLGAGVQGWNFANAPQDGTIFKYVKNPNVYRCPSVSDQYGAGVGAGSNGKFDYAMFQSLSGARITQCKRPFYKTTTGQEIQLPACPVLVQENAISFNGPTYKDGGHSRGDKLSTVHAGGSYYGAIDGSVQWFKEEPTAQSDTNWLAYPPSNKPLELGWDYTWGQWGTH